MAANQFNLGNGNNLPANVNAGNFNGLLPPVGAVQAPAQAPAPPVLPNNDNIDYFELNNVQAVITPDMLMYPYEGDRADLDAFLAYRIERAWRSDYEMEALLLEAIQKMVAGTNLTAREWGDVKLDYKEFQRKCKDIIIESLTLLADDQQTEQSGREKLYVFFELYQCLNKCRNKPKTFEFPGVQKPNEPQITDTFKYHYRRYLRNLNTKLLPKSA